MSKQQPGRLTGRPWTRLIAYTLHTKGTTCQLNYPNICTKLATTADHTQPISQGGTNHPDNLQPACQPCNQHKSNNPNPTRDQDQYTRQW